MSPCLLEFYAYGSSRPLTSANQKFWLKCGHAYHVGFVTSPSDNRWRIVFGCLRLCVILFVTMCIFNRHRDYVKR